MIIFKRHKVQLILGKILIDAVPEIHEGLCRVQQRCPDAEGSVSGMGSSVQDIKKLCPNAEVEPGSALNALLNMDEKGNDGIDMDDEPETPKSEKEVVDRPAKNIPFAEKTVGTGQDKGIRQYADVPAERVSLKAKLEVMKAKVAGGYTEKPMPQKARGKEETL